MQATKKVNSSLNYICPFYSSKHKKQGVSSDFGAETLGSEGIGAKIKLRRKEMKIPRIRKCYGSKDVLTLGREMDGAIC